ncbi:alpha amylase C-terminal domain-containing protein [Micromonospora sp. BRA006-A]|nr:alpha amylase C-terminal domain-containing protein [Micromonospora sp. BRA006-A]
MPAGRYCDVIHGTFSNGSCSGPLITVDSSGWFAANVPAHDAIAIHIGAKLS